MKPILKKWTAYLLTLAMLITLVPFSVLSVSAELSGSGTETDPILIGTLDELEAFRDSVNGGNTYEGKYVLLTDNIGMGETYGEGKLSWTPIGGVMDAAYNPCVFEGSFDGGGYTISGLYIESSDPYQGLFGYVGQSGTVKNVNVAGEVIVKNNNVGLVVGNNLGIISNVRASGSADGIYEVGLIAGKNGKETYYLSDTKRAKIENSHADGTVNGYTQVGLIAGTNKSLISQCSSSGTFSLDNSSDMCKAGGICGENSGDYAVVEYSYNAARYTDKTNNNTAVRVGGICGWNYSAKISYCYNTVTIEAYNAGGIACLNYGGTITQCYQYGRTKCPGVTGYYEFEGDVNPIAKNKSGTEEIGTVIESYYYIDNNNAEYPGESGNFVNHLSFQDELSGWDFDTVWKMDALLGRPFLRNNSERGSVDKPHEITGPETLKKFSYAVNNGDTYEGEYIKLTIDIRYRLSKWTPIGTYDAADESNSKPFKGNFDGEGHLIFEWGIDDPESDYQGLFGYTDGATIKNLRVSGEVIGKNHVGMIVGYSKNSTIENVTAQGSVTGKQYVGGIAGKCDNGTIQRSQNRATVSAEEYVGGVAGYIGGDVYESFNTAAVNGTNYVGGIVGLCESSRLGIRNVYNIGNVTADGQVAGGICGGLKNSEIAKAYNLGEVNLLGDTHGVIYGEPNIAKVTGAYSLAGSQYGVEQLTAEQFKKQETFEDFDFQTMWAMNPYLGRPVLRSCKEYAGGTEDGTEENPYTVNNLDDLEAFRDSVNGGETYEEKYVKLTADIDLGEKYGADINGQEVSWTAIGDNNSDKPFNGVFDGDHHKITGLYINRGVYYSQSLFGYIGGSGTVKNLVVSGEITETSGSGIVVGKNGGTLQNVRASGKVSASQYIGGICGENYGTIENCSNEATVTAEGGTGGGICGDNNGSIKNCFNTGSVTGKDTMGGICGYNSHSSRGTTIQNCYNAALVTGNENVGGICGLNSGSINNCYNVGAVTATNNAAGGISGCTDSGLSNCYNYANVISNGRKAAICAFVNSRTTPSNNYYNGDAFDGAAYLNEVGDAIQSGKLTEADFADKTKFDGFDFENTWVMYEKAGRPMLKGIEEPDGTEYNPLKIRTLADLEEFGKSVNGGNNYTDKKVLLLADIDMSETYGKGKKSWTPIGYWFSDRDHSTWFNGTFEGNGHKITGLYIEGDAEDQGLFGTVESSGTIRNLTVSGNVSGTNRVGLLVGWNIGVIENVTVYGSANGSAQVGGIVGYNDTSSSYIKQCTNFAAISGEKMVGGIVGGASGSTVQECRNMGTIYASGYYAGGISGQYGMIQNCYNTAPVSADDYGAGGIVGTGWYKTQNCYNTAPISAGSYVGGISGFDGSAENSYHTTDVDNGIGTAITEAELADQNTFATWDFATVWHMNPLLGRPVLRSNIEGESGTESDPYVIDSLEKLERVRDNVNGGASFAGEFLRLTADIDLSQKYNINNQWTPIGTPEKPFSGSFDGNGHTVSGLYINDVNAINQGLFGVVSGGKIEKLAVTDAQVIAKQYFAGIAGVLKNSTIENCYYNGKLGANEGVYGYYGSIAGDTELSSVINCYAVAQIPDYSPYASDAGGVVVGYAGDGSVITSCYFNSDGNYGREAVGRTYNTVVTDTAGKTGAELGNQETYVGWDFDTVWSMHPIMKLPTFAGNGFSGDGTAENPYILHTLGDLEILASGVNVGNTFEGVYFALDADIDMSGKYNAETTKSWTPIGSYSNKFCGIFDGRNHTVNGLYIKDRSDEYNGLFGFLAWGGVIRNLNVVGTIENCGGKTGALVGTVDSGATVENCTAEAVISAPDSYYVGGLVGMCYGTIKNSRAVSCDVTAAGTAGGLVGEASNAVIQNSYSTGSVSGQSYVGGLVGSFAGTAVNCYSLSSVTDGKPLFGYGWGTVVNCYYSGNKGDTFSESIKKAAQQFESGEVAYLLAQGCTVHDDFSDDDIIYDGSIWKQTVGQDKYPNFDGLTVYATTNCVTYNNSGDTSNKEHVFDENGVCTGCGMYKGATLIDGVYQIRNERDLIWFAELVNGGENAANAILKNSIYLNPDAIGTDESLDVSDKAALTVFTPMGSIENPYEGTFDGDGYAVSGVYIDDDGLPYAGFFGVTGESAVIKDLHIRQSYVSAKTYVGMLAGQNNGTVENCITDGKVIGRGNCVGGLCGENTGTIRQGEFRGTVSMQDAGNYIGGIVGVNVGTVESSILIGWVVGGENHACVGGIAGENGSYYDKEAGIIRNCTNIGSVSGYIYVGGIVGENYGTVQNCTSATESFDTRVQGVDIVGGIVGSNRGSVSRCRNNSTANVIATTDDTGCTGGIVGSNFGSVQDCINSSSQISAALAGGIVGKNHVDSYDKGTVAFCVNTTTANGVVADCNADDTSEIIRHAYYIENSDTSYTFGTAVSNDTAENGKLTYLLQNGRTDLVWGQRIGQDKTPQLTTQSGMQVYRARFTAADGTVIEQYYTYYDYIQLPNGVLWLTKDGKIVLGSTQIDSDIEAWESLYGIRGYGSNLTVHAPKGNFTLIVAGYTADGALIDMGIVPLTFDEGGQQEVVVPVSGSVIKAMLVNNLVGMMPVSQFSLIP